MRWQSRHLYHAESELLVIRVGLAQSDRRQLTFLIGGTILDAKTRAHRSIFILNLPKKHSSYALRERSPR